MLTITTTLFELFLATIDTPTSRESALGQDRSLIKEPFTKKLGFSLIYVQNSICLQQMAEDYFQNNHLPHKVPTMLIGANNTIRKGTD